MNIKQDIPKASVLLPVYNAGKYLDVAIESILGQSFTDFELLLLNDGSTDNSLDRLEYYSALDSRCRVHSWPNCGIIETLNQGINLSRGDILFRMDADDVSYPYRFEKQINYLEVNPECVALGSRVMLIDPEGCQICPLDTKVSHDEIDTAHLVAQTGALITHPSVAMRKSAVVQIGGYRKEFLHAEDIDLFLRLAEIGLIANLPNVLLDYRQHMGSIGYVHRKTQLNSSRSAVDEAIKRRKLPESSLRGCDVAAPTHLVNLAEIHRKWAWWALSGGNLNTARKHALKALRKSPFNMGNFKLLACVLRGY